MERIPCIKCTPELWGYIKPYLKEWGYYTTSIGKNFNEIFCILTLNWNKDINCCGFGDDYIIKDIGSEITNDVEEFLERAAKLKGKTYKRKDMEFHGIEIKPGMVFITGENSHWIVFPTKNDIAVMSYEQASCLNLNNFFKYYEKEIKVVRNLTDNISLSNGAILWQRPKEVILTMDEIAKKFGYSVEQIRIK